MWLILRPARPVYRPREAALANLPFTSRLSDESHSVRASSRLELESWEVTHLGRYRAREVTKPSSGRANHA